MIRQLIEWAALGIELLAVAALVTAVAVIHSSQPRDSTLRLSTRDAGSLYELQTSTRQGLMPGLDPLVAADVYSGPSRLSQPCVMSRCSGLLVFIRTFLSWSMMIEIEGHWP